MFSRRQVLRSAAAAASASILPEAARAADYPARPVHIAVTTAPGGSSDIVSRLSAQFLTDRLGQTFLIDNRPGAGGNIATGVVHRAPADGYSILSINKGNVLANQLYDKLEFDFMRDFVPVAGIATGPLVMLAHPSVPVKTLPEFLAYAKANPGKINYASAGNGSDPHMTGELLKMMTGIQMTHVPYRGGALALTDLLAGSVQLMFSNLPTADYIAAGTLRGLGVTTKARIKEMPDIPAVAEFVPGFAADVWFAFVARKSTPPEFITTLNRAMAEALAEPKVRAGLAVLTAAPMTMSPQELGALFASEHEKWGRVIKTANIKPE